MVNEEIDVEIDTYIDDDGVERHDACGETEDECTCVCSECGDGIWECSCNT